MTNWKPKLETGQPLHEAIIRALQSDIAIGRLQSGARLPAHRILAEQLGISLGTVTRALNVAATRGLVRGETGRGTFVCGPITTSFGALDVGDVGLIDLSRTWPLNAFDPDISPVLRAIAKSSDRGELLQYQNNCGMFKHRDAGVDWARRFGIETDSDNVVVCAGAQHALVVTLSSLVRPGDYVFAEELTYPGFKAAAQLLHLKVVGLPIDTEGIVPAGFEAACKLRQAKVVYCTPTLHNPTTGTMSMQRRLEIIEIAKTYGVVIIEDDVHRLLADEPPPPLASLAPEHTYFIAGMSKSVLGALRVAFLIAPLNAIDKLTEHVWATAWMAAPLTAEVASRWIADGTADATVARKRVEAAKRVELAKRVLEGFSFRSASCGYHIWLELPEYWKPDTFANESRRRGVVVSMCDTFAVGDERKLQAVRICLSSPPDVVTLETGLQRVLNVLKSSPGFGPILV